MKINIKELLDFSDDKKESEKGDANAIMSILGEDLNAAAYRHFRKDEVDILEENVVQGFQGGKHLDRWILDKKENRLFQCEIKNWAATAIGGKSLKSNADKEHIKKVAKGHWKHQLSTNLSRKPTKKHKHPNGVSKVLLTMRNPSGYNSLAVEPLLIYWMPISSDKAGLKSLSYISSLPIKTAFKKLHIFSVSLYLRQLYKQGKGKKFIELEMPHFKHRMKILTKFQTSK